MARKLRVEFPGACWKAYTEYLDWQATEGPAGRAKAYVALTVRGFDAFRPAGYMS